MRYTRTSKDATDVKKERFFKVMDYDPELTLPQIVERFGIAYSVASHWRKEWRESK